MPGQPESRRTCLIRRPPRTRQALDPRLDLPVIRDQTLPEHLTSDTIDRRSHDGSCVHIQTNTRTLTHTGASHNCRIGRAGSPRSVTHESCERGPGPTTPQQSRAVTTYRLVSGSVVTLGSPGVPQRKPSLATGSATARCDGQY